ncbi:MAG: mannose-1-phosphate guanylyltransferase [Spirochaetaceae bacterium]|jgi:mannose-1-phosphate guanylyltransferase/mannose-1-phosphate guanylyltransferase/mannose-6-phosphate isomerase|nr:mannose-1-phosphate guanylyltransferase [Spirochaetaceae bacterium]
MFDDCLIMAGGSGTRLWPASNSRNPKQFLSIPGGGSFFVSAVERALAVINRDGDGRVIIIAGHGHVPRVIESCAAFSPADRSRMILIPEPAARNTAPAIACGAVYSALALGPDRTTLVLTSDHIIRPLAVFAEDAAAAEVFARQGRLVVFGIPPGSPETGYGYIETAEALSCEDAASRTAVFRAASFREKPGRSAAEAFLAAGGFYWNSGMFAFSSGFLLEEFRRSAPDCLRPFAALTAPEEPAYSIRQGLRILDEWPGLSEAYQNVEGVSFDYAIAEKCGQTVMTAARFDWFDVGSWDEYAKLLDASRSEVYAARIPPGREGSCFVDADIPVALCGVEDLIVVVRSGGGVPAVLIAKKGETQGVRDIAAQIAAAGRTELL